MMETYTFTKQDVLMATGITNGRLRGLTTSKIINPYRPNENLNARPLFSWSQLLQIKLIEKLRKNFSMQKIKTAIKNFKKISNEDLSKVVIVCSTSEIFVCVDNELGELIATQLTGDDKFQIIALYAVQELETEVDELANKSNLVDFNNKKIGVGCLMAVA